MRHVSSTFYWPKTRIRRKGMAAHRQIRMRGTLKSIAATLIIFLFFALGYVWTRLQVIETGYHLRHLEEAREGLKEENRALTLEVAMLKSPQRLEIAANGMGLKRPAESQVRFLRIKIAGDL